MDTSKKRNAICPVTKLELQRRAAGMTMDALSRKAGRARQVVSWIESGRLTMGSADAEAFAEALGTPVLDVVGMAAPSDVDAAAERVARQNATLACSVRSARQERGFTQEKLSVRTGIPVKRLASIEAGREQASLVEALVLSEALEKRVEELFSRKDRGPLPSAGEAAAKKMIGKRFGSLVVIDRNIEGFGQSRGASWLCRCDCGAICRVRDDHLKSGHTTSCGCRAGRGRKAGA